VSELNPTIVTSAESANKRVELVTKAASAWINELVDLGGRNNLLYYRDLNLDPPKI
ncbi:unnamed protein product, partial [Acidithrix sp. C25]